MEPVDAAAAARLAAIHLEAERLEESGIYPWYNMKDYEPPEGLPEENYFECFVLRILIDSDEGRAYGKLSTDVERLEYMRKHAHDKYQVVNVDHTFYEDREEGKTYLINTKSPEYKGLQKILREDGSSWSPEDKEYEAMIKYYKDYATKVEDTKKCPCRLCSE
jgi:hypothetical protein